MKRILIIVCILASTLTTWGQSLQIKGRIATGDGKEPVEFANVVLNRASDSTFVTGTTTDLRGRFSIPNLYKGDYQIIVSCLGYEAVAIAVDDLQKNLDMGIILLDSASVMLDEVVISTSHVIQKIDRQILFPTSAQLRNAANGMDVLNNLKLPGLILNRIENSVSGARGGAVQFRVNGAPADSKEIQALLPSDIIRIEYHDEPSLRYGDVEAVIDYIVRRRESGGTVMVSAMNSPVIPFGENFLNTKLNYKKSEFNLMYGYIYRGYDEMSRTSEEHFQFDPGHSLTRVEDGDPTRWKIRRHMMNANYSLMEPEKYLFSASLNFHQRREPVKDFSSFLYPVGNREQGVYMTDNTTLDNKIPSLDLYYQHHLKNKQLLVLNVVGTYIGTNQERFYREERYNEYLTDIHSNVDGKKYSIIGEGIYEKEMKAGRLSTGLKHTQSITNNDYLVNQNLSETSMKQSDTYLYTEFMGRVNKFMYTVGAGVTRAWFSQGSQGYTRYDFRPSLRLGYTINEYSQIRYRGDMYRSSPALSELSDVTQPIDSLQLRRGNPDLNPVMNYVNRLTYSYNRKNIRFTLSANDYYYRKPIMEQTTYEDGWFVRSTANQRSWHKLNLDLYMRASFLKEHFIISGSGGYNYFDSRGNDYKHTLGNWYMRAFAEGNYKDVSLFVEFMFRNNSLYGETVTYGERVMTVGASYRWKNLHAMAFIINPGMNKGWKLGSDNLNEIAGSKRREFIPETSTLLAVRVSWNFQFGRKYQSAQKRLNNRDDNSGVLEGGK